MTITDFLLSRLGEDRAEAEAAIAERESIDFNDPPEVPDMALTSWPDAPVPAVLVGPERVLVDLEGKRQIVRAHRERPGLAEHNQPAPDRCATCRDHLWPCKTLRQLAVVYADHPDYDHDWRP